MVLSFSLAATAYANSILFQSEMHRDTFLENSGMTLAPALDATFRGVPAVAQQHSSPNDGHHGNNRTDPHTGPHPDPHQVAEPNPAALFLFSLVPVALIGGVRRRRRFKK